MLSCLAHLNRLQCRLIELDGNEEHIRPCGLWFWLAVVCCKEEAGDDISSCRLSSWICQS